MFYKKIITGLFVFLALQLAVFADEFDDVKNFFQSFVDTANSHSPKLVDYYLPNAKIIRVVEKPDGTHVPLVIPMDEYVRQLHKGRTAAKIARYRNSYTNRVVTKIDGDYKLTATRTPGSDKVGLPSYFIITKDSNDKFKIKEESMNTKVQTFLKHVK